MKVPSHFVGGHMTLNEWLAGISVPAGIRGSIFHPPGEKKQEIYKQYPTQGDFQRAYGFQPDEGWYDPQTGKPLLLQNTNPVDPNAADIISKGMMKGRPSGVKK